MEKENVTQELLSLRSNSSGPWIVEVGSALDSGRCELKYGERLIVGSAAGVDLRIRDPTVSGRHCELSAGPEGLELRDLGSKNGVFVGAARVERAWLRGNPACVVVGGSTVVIRGHEESEPGNVEPLPGLVGNSDAIRRVAVEVRRHARLRAPILLQGESGTGKDVVARALHLLSGRQGQYTPLNVGAVPESLADAELFGHRRGAFTGAVASRPGAFEQAHRGTLFLDEIAELAPSIQVKLLRVVEDGQIRAVGGMNARQVDVRIVSATWAKLPDRIALGQFRADLYHRLSTVLLAIPPLRSRKSDIPLLSDTLLKRLAPELGEKRIASAALARLVAHHWPGNVRELSSVLYRAAVSAPNVMLGAEHIKISAGPLPIKCRLGPADAEQLLAKHAGNISAAARAASVPRSTFRAWLRRVG